MALTIESKHHLHTQLELIMDKEAASTMMEIVAPFDWSELATKKDLQILKAELNESIAKSTEGLARTFVGWMLTGNSILVAAFAAVVIFAK